MPNPYLLNRTVDFSTVLHQTIALPNYYFIQDYLALLINRYTVSTLYCAQPFRNCHIFPTLAKPILTKFNKKSNQVY